MGYHPGADLNLNVIDEKTGRLIEWNADKGMLVHSISDGEVIFAGLLEKTWGNVVVVWHPPLSDGTPVYSRYAHLASIGVSAGDRVSKGKVIGTIGTMPGWPGYEHLDFAISCTDILRTEPGYWPGGGEKGKAGVKKHFVDPRRFLQTYR